MTAYIAFVVGLALGAAVMLLVLSLFIVGSLGEEDLPEPPRPQRWQD